MLNPTRVRAVVRRSAPLEMPGTVVGLVMFEVTLPAKAVVVGRVVGRLVKVEPRVVVLTACIVVLALLAALATVAVDEGPGKVVGMLTPFSRQRAAAAARAPVMDSLVSYFLKGYCDIKTYSVGQRPGSSSGCKQQSQQRIAC